MTREPQPPRTSEEQARIMLAIPGFGLLITGAVLMIMGRFTTGLVLLSFGAALLALAAYLGM